MIAWEAKAGEGRLRSGSRARAAGSHTGSLAACLEPVAADATVPDPAQADSPTLGGTTSSAWAPTPLQDSLTRTARPSGRMNHTELPSDSVLPGLPLGDCELELPGEVWSSGANRPGCRVPSGGSLRVGPALLDLGRQGQRATGEVATGDDRARLAWLARLDGHGLGTAGEVGTHRWGVVQDRSGRVRRCWHAVNSKL